MPLPRKLKFLLLTAALTCLAAAAQPATTIQAQEARANLRERVKERIKERLAERRDGRPPREKAGETAAENVVLEHNGVSRSYLIHLPSGYDATRAYPLVLAFHGGGGSSAIMANDTFYKWPSKADQEGFIVAFPNGASPFKGGKFATWNAGNCCAHARDSGSDDTGFVGEVIRDIRAKWNVDERRIYATGMSNGAMMSYRLACDMAGTFAAIAAVAGTDNYDQCRPSGPVSILHIHAKDDTHVLYQGGAGKDAFKDASKVTDFTSVDETMRRWVERNGCPDAAEKTFENEGAYCARYSGCAGGRTVQLCVTENGGHSWPGGVKPRKKAAQTTTAIDATDAIWEFFKEASSHAGN